MNKKRRLAIIIGAVVLVLAIFLVTSYNSLVKKDEKVSLQWNEVQNAYQRRLDLIPNIVTTVRGGAEFEQNTLVKVTEARSRAASVNVTGLSAESYAAQTAAQDELAAVANRLLITVEKYPELQGTRAFKTLQTQLERTELRIKMARKDFNEAIRDYNSSARNFPMSLAAGLFGFKPKPGFIADAGAEQATEIKF